MQRKRTGKRTQRKPKKQIGTMDIILIIVGVMLFSFTVTMIATFREYGAIPDTLVTCVFAALGGECGVMGWIKTTKERRMDRTWELEDRKEAEQAAEPPQETMDKEDDATWH